MGFAGQRSAELAFRSGVTALRDHENFGLPDALRIPGEVGGAVVLSGLDVARVGFGLNVSARSVVVPVSAMTFPSHYDAG
jgi:hypothetical protein